MIGERIRGPLLAFLAGGLSLADAIWTLKSLSEGDRSLHLDLVLMGICILLLDGLAILHWVSEARARLRAPKVYRSMQAAGSSEPPEERSDARPSFSVGEPGSGKPPLNSDHWSQLGDAGMTTPAFNRHIPSDEPPAAPGPPERLSEETHDFSEHAEVEPDVVTFVLPYPVPSSDGSGAELKDREEEPLNILACLAEPKLDAIHAGGLKDWVTDYIKSLSEGQIVVAAAEQMLVDKKERVTVRISEQTREQLLAELGEQISNLKIEDISIAPVMSVTLDGPKFDIKTHGAADRIVHHNETWEFTVTPFEKGRTELKVLVAVIVALPGYHSEKPNYVGVKTIAIEVTVSYRRQLGKWLSKNWSRAPIWIAATVIAGGVGAFYKIDAVKHYMIHLFNGAAAAVGLPTIPE